MMKFKANNLLNNTDEMKNKINDAITDGLNYGYRLDHNRYFFVDKFYVNNFLNNTITALQTIEKEILPSTKA